MVAAYEFDAILVKLTVASRLGTVVAEHRANVIELGVGCADVQPVFQIAARHRGGSLRAEGKLAPFLVCKAVHFLFHHIRSLSGASFKELGLFKDRSGDLLIAAGRSQLAKR